MSEFWIRTSSSLRPLHKYIFILHTQIWTEISTRNCATHLAAYYAQKENDYGNETYSRI